jgi:hypothetical protein
MVGERFWWGNAHSIYISVMMCDLSPGTVAHNIVSGVPPFGDAFGATFGATKIRPCFGATKFGDALVPRGFSRPSTHEPAAIEKAIAGVLNL